MNNDISDVNKFMKTTRQQRLSNSAESCHNCAPNISSCEESESKKASMKSSMDYLGTMGCAQVNMSNPLTKRVKSSVDSFLDNPEYVQEHTDLCDKLVEEGMPLEEAVIATDEIFNTLKDKNTYKEDK